jgi:uncharacterized membrane protein YbhN (UPF0104 family)
MYDTLPLGGARLGTAPTVDHMSVSDDNPGGDFALDERTANRKLLHGLISLAVLLALVVGLVLAVPGLRGVGRTVAHMNPWLVAAAIGLEVLSCLGYVLAFLQVFDRAPIRFGARVALAELAFGAAVSLGGAGSVAVGAWLLIERGGPPKRVVERSAVLFLLTSGVNVITLALAGLVSFFGILPGSRDPWLTLVPALVALAALAFFLAIPRLAKGRLAARGPTKLRVFMETSVVSIEDTRRLLFTPDWRLIGAYAFLWCDIAVLVVCFAAAGVSPPLTTIVLAYQIAYITNVIPVPGNIGVLDGSMVAMFALFGVGATVATAATVVYHAIALWVPAMWGTVAYIVLRLTRNRPLEPRPPLEERRRLRRLRRLGRNPKSEQEI